MICRASNIVAMMIVAVWAGTIRAQVPNVYYTNIHDAYMSGRWPEFDTRYKDLAKNRRELSPAQIANITAMNKAAKDYQPKWWDATKQSRETKFKAEIWGRPFIANYQPSGAIGYQAMRAMGNYVNTPEGEKFMATKLEVWVSWRPSLVDSPKPGEGELADAHQMTEAHMAETIVWHELGHNYITTFLPVPVRHMVEMYNTHRMLFAHLQEFYADMTAIHHASPKARLNTMMFRLNEFEDYDETEQHTRAAHGIGSIFLAKVLSEVAADKTKWPSLHFPPQVPKKDIELEVLRYVYETIDPSWTFEEDTAWREYAGDWITKNGNTVLKTGGQLSLPNDLKMFLMVAEDRQAQQDRDKWVASKLYDIIQAGRADTAAAQLGKRIYIPGMAPRIRRIRPPVPPAPPKPEEKN